MRLDGLLMFCISLGHVVDIFPELSAWIHWRVPTNDIDEYTTRSLSALGAFQLRQVIVARVVEVRSYCLSETFIHVSEAICRFREPRHDERPTCRVVRDS